MQMTTGTKNVICDINKAKCDIYTNLHHCCVTKLAFWTNPNQNNCHPSIFVVSPMRPYIVYRAIVLNVLSTFETVFQQQNKMFLK